MRWFRWKRRRSQRIPANARGIIVLPTEADDPAELARAVAEMGRTGGLPPRGRL